MYTTTNMYLAAGLVANGHSLAATDRGPGTLVFFRFTDPDGALAGVEQAYWGRTMPAVQPHAYVTALMLVRDSMYSAQRG